MLQWFYVLFNTVNSVFYRDSQLGDTKDMLKAERFFSCKEAEKQLKCLKEDAWTVRKVTVSLEEN